MHNTKEDALQELEKNHWTITAAVAAITYNNLKHVENLEEEISKQLKENQ